MGLVDGDANFSTKRRATGCGGSGCRKGRVSRSFREKREGWQQLEGEALWGTERFPRMS